MSKIKCWKKLFGTKKFGHYSLYQRHAPQFRIFFLLLFDKYFFTSLLRITCNICKKNVIKIGAMIYFFSDFKSQKLKMNILVKENISNNWEIIFAQVSEHYASFWIKNAFWSILRGGVYMSLTRNNPKV